MSTAEKTNSMLTDLMVFGGRLNVMLFPEYIK